jgi:hypothetical protein
MCVVSEVRRNVKTGDASSGSVASGSSASTSASSGSSAFTCNATGSAVGFRTRLDLDAGIGTGAVSGTDNGSVVVSSVAFFVLYNAWRL